MYGKIRDYKGKYDMWQRSKKGKVNGIKGSDRTTSSIIVKWNSLSAQGVTGYKVYKCSNAKGEDAKLVATVSGTSKKITGLTAKKKYFVRVRTYKLVNGNKVYSYWSGYKTVTTKK